MQIEEIIECDKKYFMNVFSGRYPVVIDHGTGVRVFGKDGSQYIDFLAGIGVNALGYAHPRLVAALEEQIKKMIHTSNLYYIEPQAYLEKLLINNSCADRVFFVNSGAEANEGAIKLARKYFKVKGENRYEIITAENSFHGRTLATLAATGQKKYQTPFQPLPVGFKSVPFNDLEAVEQAIGSETAAIMLEPVQGEGGVFPATAEYLQGLKELCTQEGILLIFDEIQCGLGRTGSLFAYQDYGVEPDILTLAKALGGGVPIGAFLAKEEVARAFEPGDHGSTFGGNHLATRAACTTLEVILEDGFLDKVRETGRYFKGRLNDLQRELDLIREVRGKGLMLALELADSIPAADVTMAMFTRGFLINAVRKHTLRFLPPLIIGKTEIDQMISELKGVLANYQ
ncbi:MAG: acetylornithine/N-succinyldiaminopimelate aminotransferase [Halanaerobiales bacterium]|nr:acetylornithine/N-succinyldiaminopimelate aminotransferase [Halanaerobiales bacterium]